MTNVYCSFTTRIPDMQIGHPVADEMESAVYVSGLVLGSAYVKSLTYVNFCVQTVMRLQR